MCRTSLCLPGLSSSRSSLRFALLFGTLVIVAASLLDAAEARFYRITGAGSVATGITGFSPTGSFRGPMPSPV